MMTTREGLEKTNGYGQREEANSYGRRGRDKWLPDYREMVDKPELRYHTKCVTEFYCAKQA